MNVTQPLSSFLRAENGLIKLKQCFWRSAAQQPVSIKLIISPAFACAASSELPIGFPALLGTPVDQSYLRTASVVRFPV
jgi:hypothetical protein